MDPVRQSLDDFEIRAHAICRSCGKTRKLEGDDLHGAASVEAFKELERRLRCSDCGERSVSVEPIWHKDWDGSREN
jgi:ribosomal protein L37E